MDYTDICKNSYFVNTEHFARGGRVKLWMQSFVLTHLK